MNQIANRCVKDGFIPLFIMLLSVSIAVLLARLFKLIFKTEFQASTYVIDEKLNPSYGRFIYFLLALTLSLILTTVSEKLYEKK